MSNRKTKISIVAGARPNFMKIAPIIRELRKHEDVFDWSLVHTGQHYDRDMSDVFFEGLGIPEPHYHLDAGGGSHAEQTAKIMVGFEKLCLECLPKLVIVVGDVNSTLACAIVAKKLNIKVAHVEAGLRSRDMTMPEEINRIVTDSISDYLFVTESSAVRNLREEGKHEENIFFVGHVMIDNLMYQIERLSNADLSLLSTTAIKESLKHYGVVTLHRAANVDSREALENVISALSQVAQILPLVFTIHPRTKRNLEKFGVEIPKSIIQVPPLPYMEFLNLWKDSVVILTDSGGVQEESTALGVPCITLRENTERPITVTNGTNVVVGNDKSRILAAVHNALNNARQEQVRRPELWDGNAAIRIVERLVELAKHNEF